MPTRSILTTKQLSHWGHPFEPDKQTWIRISEGCQFSYEQILRFYYPPLEEYGYRLCQDIELTRDCIQELFLNIWKQRGSLSIPDSIKAYLLTSFRRYIIKSAKAKLATSRIEKSIDWELPFQSEMNIESYLVSKEIKNETLLRLKKELSLLTNRQREAIYLRFFHEMEYDEIAQIMSIQQHSAVNLVYEGIRTIRKNWIM